MIMMQDRYYPEPQGLGLVPMVIEPMDECAASESGT